MNRCSQSTWRPGAMDGRVLPEVAYRLCLLFESEIDLGQHLKFHRNYLMELGLDKLSVLKFFGSDQGISSMGGLVSQASVRRILVDRLGSLSPAQCDALLRRINPSGSCLASFDELCKVLLPGPALTMSSWSPSESPYRPSGLQAIEPAYDDTRLATPIAWKDRRELSATPPKQRLETQWRTPPRSTDFGRSSEWGKDLSRDWSPSRCSPVLAEPGASCYTAFRESSPRLAALRAEVKVPDLRCPGLGSTRASSDDFRPTSPACYAPSLTLASPVQDRSSILRATSPLSPRLRAASPLSPRALRPHFEGALFGSSQEWRSQAARRVLNVMVRQAGLDAQAEDAKSLLPPNTCLEAIFATLDRFHKGYVTDTDLCQYSQDFGGTASFAAFASLVHEVLLCRPRDAVAIPGRLTMRELGSLVLPAGSQEQEATLAANSDEELKSILYLLRHSEPCPRCSIRVQRDADSAGCPSVTCPCCGTTFRCFVVVGDFYNGAAAENAPLPVAAQYHLFRLLDNATRVADELEQGRKQLQLEGRMANGEGGIGMLSTAFAHIGDGRLSFLMGDLRRALFSQEILISEQQLGLLWRRYAPRTGAEVNFSDFVRQLKPREFPL